MRPGKKNASNHPASSGWDPGAGGSALGFLEVSSLNSSVPFLPGGLSIGGSVVVGLDGFLARSGSKRHARG